MKLYKKFLVENVFRLRDKLQQKGMLTVAMRTIGDTNSPNMGIF